MQNWRDDLVSDIHTELGAKPAIAILATVDDSEPAARCVVVRQVLGDGTLQMVSDSRSQKNSQLKKNAAAVAVFWFSKLRRQYRLSGQVKILSEHVGDDSRRLAAWTELSDSARALFYWPPSGETLRDNAWFPKIIPVESEIPPSFEVLMFATKQVETLDLNCHPHQRIQWILHDGNWNPTPIYP